MFQVLRTVAVLTQPMSLLLQLHSGVVSPVVKVAVPGSPAVTDLHTQLHPLSSLACLLFMLKHRSLLSSQRRSWKSFRTASPPSPRQCLPFSPPGQMKSLEQSLENRIPGNRNVYIRGLHPTTDDELLFLFASRFGAVETSKAIIDTGTGACKGFGFAKFVDAQSSEMCIRGFHRLGYEVGFARESFNSRLKAQGDDGSTNLYISNLPKTLNEVELGTIFLGYNILSSKILRDSMGNSRGVGFARFEGRMLFAMKSSASSMALASDTRAC
uniref:RRM domain-containing protein n=1 Tax=Bionectria ochroleuca TaxID=29856 RepID=A0A8H7NP35_BIOOC